MQSQDVRKSIYILPNLFTSLNLFCGYCSITFAVEAKFIEAAVAILVGSVFDLLDGKIARATNTTSRFGVEYDSLADLVTFGLAPALLIYLWLLETMGRVGWAAALLFTLCGALRLARFNTYSSSKPDFEGLPIPAAAALSSLTILFFSRLGISPEPYKMAVLIMMFVLSFCMVSSFPYKSLKKVSLFKSMRFNKLVGFVLILVAIAAEPIIFLFVVSLTYMISGPFLFLLRHLMPAGDKKRRVDKGF